MFEQHPRRDLESSHLTPDAIAQSLNYEAELSTVMGMRAPSASHDPSRRHSGSRSLGYATANRSSRSGPIVLHTATRPGLEYQRLGLAVHDQGRRADAGQNHVRKAG